MPVPAVHCICFLVDEDFSPFPRYRDAKVQKIDFAPARSLDNQADQYIHAERERSSGGGSFPRISFTI